MCITYVEYYKKDNVDSVVEHFMYLTKTFVVTQTVQYWNLLC